MTRSLKPALLIALLPLGCEGVAPVACTAEFVFGLSVEVVDAVTGSGLADGATLTIRSGEWVETVSGSFDGASLFGAGERPGVYELTVARAGYQTWLRTGVVVTADECHVIPVALRAELVAIQEAGTVHSAG